MIVKYIDLYNGIYTSPNGVEDHCATTATIGYDGNGFYLKLGNDFWDAAPLISLGVNGKKERDEFLKKYKIPGCISIEDGYDFPRFASISVLRGFTDLLNKLLTEKFDNNDTKPSEETKSAQDESKNDKRCDITSDIVFNFKRRKLDLDELH